MSFQIPLFKKGDTNDCNYYHGISIAFLFWERFTTVSHNHAANINGFSTKV
jgi:hypothetical protein